MLRSIGKQLMESVSQSQLNDACAAAMQTDHATCVAVGRMLAWNISERELAAGQDARARGVTELAGYKPRRRHDAARQARRDLEGVCWMHRR